MLFVAPAFEQNPSQLLRCSNKTLRIVRGYVWQSLHDTFVTVSPVIVVTPHCTGGVQRPSRKTARASTAHLPNIAGVLSRWSNFQSWAWRVNRFTTELRHRGQVWRNLNISPPRQTVDPCSGTLSLPRERRKTTYGQCMYSISIEESLYVLFTDQGSSWLNVYLIGKLPLIGTTWKFWLHKTQRNKRREVWSNDSWILDQGNVCGHNMIWAEVLAEEGMLALQHPTYFYDLAPCMWLLPAPPN